MPMSVKEKSLVWLHGEVKTPPFTIVYRIESDAIVILEVFEKKTSKTPKTVMATCKDRLKVYNREIK